MKMRFIIRFLVFCNCLIVCQNLTRAADSWTKMGELKHLLANVSFNGIWESTSGLRIKIETTNSTENVLITLKPRNCVFAPSSSSEFLSYPLESIQYNPDALPTSSLTNAVITLKFRPEAWAVYIEGRPVIVAPPPFYPPLSILQPDIQIPAYSTNFHIRKVEEEIHYENNFLEAGDVTNLLAGLTIESGIWRLHSVVDTIKLKGETIKSKKSVLQPEFSPNFYTLRGEGTNAIIIGGYDFYDMYSFEASVEIVPGEMGVVFLFKDRTSYFGYTAKFEEGSDEIILSLWKQSGEIAKQRQVYDAVTVPMTVGQWVKLRVKIFLNRVECYLDKTKVMDVALELPTGGKFGLYVTSENGVRFDDLCVKSNHDLDLRTINDIRRYTLVENGNFFPRRTFFKLFSSSTDESALNVLKTRYPQWLILGSPLHGKRVFSADFAVSGDIYSIGLLAGYQDVSKPYLRFFCSRTATNETFTLEKVLTNNTVEVLESLSLDISPQTSEPSGTVRLMWDTTSEGEMRMYKNNTLVLIYHPASDIIGAAGLYVGPFTKVTISNLVYQTERTDIYRNKYEKNRRFVEDPYMRHWSSPEGEWLELPNKEIWHKEDVFGRFVLRMPYVPNSEIHVGIEERKTNGPVWLEATRNELILRTEEKGTKQGTVLGRISVDKLTQQIQEADNAAKNMRWYTLHYEGYWLWLTSGDQLLIKSKLDKPFKGTKIRIAGFTTEQLKYSLVERYSVKDYLFTESLHEWVINGGIWEVVNRFHCDPRWSNMNGESVDATAALWAKYKFKGDFCVEVYVGMRQGWYERCGDMNITIMNPTTSPSLGYSVTCTGWDPDESQLYTKLYRNGVVVAETDKYLAPRRREKNVRRGYEPLIRDGRPVHGAWYYIKLRRKGNRLEYYFDNELAFTYDDTSPIKEGSFGLWTFKNSIVVARIRIAAEEIAPLDHIFKRVTLPISGKTTPSSAISVSKPDVIKDRNPICLIKPSLWEPSDPISQGRVEWYFDKERAPYFVFRNILGSGTMFASADISPVSRTQLAGWKFLVKRTPTAQFNFYYSAGKMSKDGKYIPRQKFFHCISGPSLSSPEFRISGATQVSPIDSTQENWHTTGKWQPVYVWIPYELPGFMQNDTDVVFCVEGFGVLQPSFELQGLFGNRPGDAYAICDLQEIRYNPPVLNINTQVADVSFTVLDAETLKQKLTTKNIVDVQRYIDGLTDDGFHKLLLKIQSRDYTATHEISWIKLHEKPELICMLDKARQSIVLQYPAPYPDLRFNFATMFAGNLQLPMFCDGFNRKVGLLPRIDASIRPVTNLPLKVTMAKLNYDFNLSHAEGTSDSPVLISLTGAVNFFENFEQRSLNNVMNYDPIRVFMGYFDPLQGTYLTVRNEGKPQRLHSVFRLRTNIANYPILSFRYVGKGMVNISLNISPSGYIKLSEKFPSAASVRYGTPLKLDGNWHLWTGFVSDAFTLPELRRDVFSASSMVLGSLDNPDQTGLFSEMWLDDIVIGPAVSRKEQLQFTPKYFDMDGVKFVRVATVPVSDTVESIITNQPSATIEWQIFSNNSSIIPEISKLKDGAYFLLLQAEDNQGNTSQISTIPFLLDTRPPETSYAFKPSDEPTCNESWLEITAKTHGGAPLDIKQLKIEFNGTNVMFDTIGSSMKHSPDTDLLKINWIYLLREQLNMAKNGETNVVTVDGICDGAGNKASVLNIPVITDFARDKYPPTLLSVAYPPCVLWSSSLESISSRTPSVLRSRTKARVIFHEGSPFQPYMAVTRIEKKLQDGAYLVIAPSEKECELIRNFPNREWNLERYPYFAFRIKRPNYSSNDKTKIELVFVFELDKEVSLCLTPTTNDNKTLSLPEPIEWQSNQWHGVSLNLMELFKEKLPQERYNMVLQRLKFRISNNSDKSPLYLQSCYVYSAWGESDAIEINAFDASGIEGILWESAGQNSGCELSPTLIPHQHCAQSWMTVRVKDRAGNLTPPIWIPPTLLKTSGLE